MRTAAISLLFFFTCNSLVAQTTKLEAFLKEHPLTALESQDFAKKRLNCKQAQEATGILYNAWAQETQKKYRDSWELKCFEIDGLKMPFEYKVFGKCPADGRSLYISMHGGGSAPTQVNNQQWFNQIHLYNPAEGIYVAPRAPWDDWNMWFKPGLDAFFEALIQTAVVEMRVNPDKVYLLGYSAGGDGVWRMAPRMADHWAAASMMAGHPGEASQVNLYHVPFMIWMGEQDAAYNRNTLAAEKGEVMDSLQNLYPNGYIHETHIIANKGHWMERADTLAVEWMPRFVRDSLPKHIRWRQEQVIRPALYWLAIEPEDAKEGMHVEAKIKGNEITILSCDYPKVRIYLNDDLLDLDKPVKVVYKREILAEQKLNRTLAVLASSLAKRGDKRMIFSTYIDVDIKD